MSLANSSSSLILALLLLRCNSSAFGILQDAALIENSNLNLFQSETHFAGQQQHSKTLLWTASSPDNHSAAALAGDAQTSASALWPLTLRTLLGLGCVGASLFVAAGGGLGGGSLLVPIYLIIFGLSTKEAVGLSNVTIVGGALANFMINIRRRHPLKPGPLIDWDVILIMEPSTMLGALVGGYVNKLLPNWVTATLLWLLLAVITVGLIKKGMQVYRKENQVAESPNSQTTAFIQQELAVPGGWSSWHKKQPSPLPPMFPLPPQEDPPPSTALQDTSQHSTTSTSTRIAAVWHDMLHCPPHHRPMCIDMHHIIPDDYSDEEDAVLFRRRTAPCAATCRDHRDSEDPEDLGPLVLYRHRWASGLDSYDDDDCGDSTDMEVQKQLPWAKIAVLTALFAVVLATDSGKQQLPCGSVGYWAVVASVVPVSVIVALLSRAYVLRKAAACSASPPACQQHTCEGDVVWTHTNSLVYPLLSVFAGLVAGMFGVGGGIVKGPLMLHMGILPDVAAATSATMIIMTSATASIVHTTLGDVRWDYGRWLFTVGFVSTFAGQLAMTALVDRLNRRSLIVFTMAVFMAVSTAAVAVQSLRITQQAVESHALAEFGSLCSGAG